MTRNALMIAGAGALLLGAYVIGRSGRGDGEKNIAARGSDTFAQFAEMFVGGDGLNEVSGQPQTLGGFIFDRRQNVVDLFGRTRQRLGGVFERGDELEPTVQPGLELL